MDGGKLFAQSLEESDDGGERGDTDILSRVEQIAETEDTIDPLFFERLDHPGYGRVKGLEILLIKVEI